MTIIIYSDKNYEQQSIECIKSFQNKVTDDIKIIYYTLNFKSDVNLKNVITHEYITNKSYYKLNFHKPTLCRLTMDLYKDTHYVYMDADFLLSKRVDFEKLKHDEIYPLASYGPVEFPCIYDHIGGAVYRETILMKYYNVPERTMRYVWSCFFVFNNDCLDFIEEWESMCNNEYLLKKQDRSYPSQDETVFNICLWKRNATKNLGFAFLNTINVNKVKFTEENKLNNFCFGECLDCNDYDWECIVDSNSILGYHGFKKVQDMVECANYLNSNEKPKKSIVIIDCFINNNKKLSLLKSKIESIKKLGFDIMVVSHSILPEEVISSVDYYLYDADNKLNEINFYTGYTWSNNLYEINVNTSPEDNIKSHEFPIIKSIRNALIFCKNLDYDKFIFSEFDSFFTEEDNVKMLRLFYKLYSSDKKYVVFNKDNFCETLFFMGQPTFFLKMIDSYFPKSIEEYNSKFTYVYPYALEIFFSQMVNLHVDDGIFLNQRFDEYFDSTNKNISRIGSLSVNILSDSNSDCYLLVTNYDKIKYKVVIKKDDDIVNQFEIEDTHIIAYKFISSCNLVLEAYDTENNLFKTEKINFDIENKDKYLKNKIVFK